ncbi:hypothetical protein [Acetobacter senegalensis]|uniref:hypothetical protein n=1 Tax=Acetobacter senegalensis TaxID=446692 RepID=UPI002651C9D6|nr:hypothetical protein [Acetobacter senegalensis]MDN7354583.1 hypothetical protein [Acetobacter senegalensis]
MRLARFSALLLLLAGTAGAFSLTLQDRPLQAVPHQTPDSSSTQLLHMIETDGARQTAETLNKTHKWSEVRQAVSSGQPDSARVIPALMPLADPSTARSLRLALRYALPAHPAAVLASTTQAKDPNFSTQAVCSPEGMPRSWRMRARQAVMAMHDIHFSVRADTCLKALDGPITP